MSQQGNTLVEVLAALTLFALAGAIVASAATINLRSVHAAALRGRLMAVAAREIAQLQLLPPTPHVHAESFVDGGTRGTVTRETVIDEDGVLATLTVTVAAPPPGPRVRLTTRMPVPW